ncbi:MULTISPECIES: citrulline utilization hydrolase CtlX [unclassified Brachybacterium]|uniref:citrulline utilization hydrolase CtlX n=1 Tax=unclassified Brachybacterium TaxID=2623841 RepID=UPI000C7F95BA|nr:MULTISPECIES: arginine deiminase-related protein [unclassified Brachybacterium]PMC75723.1 amidinotransferase [Brachybacterium sp. UMB0905]
MSLTDVLSPVRGAQVPLTDADARAARAADASGLRTAQSPSAVFLVRPHHFTPNPVTRADNAFQRLADGSPADVAARARAEVTALAAALRRAGVAVTVFDDASARRPDSVFPNNWITTHADGTVCLFPLYAPNRRPERRGDVLRRLRQGFVVRRVVDYSPGEEDGRFLEGTGAMVLDHVHRVAYACRSRRMDEELLAEFCRDRGYVPLVFDASDATGVPVYHTNVLMSIGEEIAVIGAEMIRDQIQRERVLHALRESGRTVVELTEAQVRSFAGNCKELTGRGGPVLAMSTTAHASLQPDQLAMLEAHVRVLAQPVPTIEAAGGSVRCMIAGLHLQRRAQ